MVFMVKYSGKRPSLVNILMNPVGTGKEKISCLCPVP